MLIENFAPIGLKSCYNIFLTFPILRREASLFGWTILSLLFRVNYYNQLMLNYSSPVVGHLPMNVMPCHVLIFGLTPSNPVGLGVVGVRVLAGLNSATPSAKCYQDASDVSA